MISSHYRRETKKNPSKIFLFLIISKSILEFNVLEGRGGSMTPGFYAVSISLFYK